LSAAIYICAGLLGVIAVGQLAGTVGLIAVGGIAFGGLLYIIGAIIYAMERPDPFPTVFGYHEIFHVLVVVAAAIHFGVIAGWVVPLSA
jgi:hemolysin III